MHFLRNCAPKNNDLIWGTEEAIVLDRLYERDKNYGIESQGEHDEIWNLINYSGGVDLHRL